MKRIILKVLAGITACVIIFGILWFANGFMGNPISKLLAKNAAKKYIAENYKNRDFIIDDVTYNFKISGYHANISSPSSVDTHFTLSVSMFGQVKYDSYSNVTKKYNTYMRIEEEYRQIVDEVFSADNFPLTSHIDFGTLKEIEDIEMDERDRPAYGIQIKDLEVDKQYNVRELGKTAGQIIFYAEDEEISYAKASEILLILKEVLDKEGVPFYAIDFVLEKPRGEETKTYDADEAIRIEGFLYSDIVEEGLSKRIEDAHKKLMEYYKIQDEKRGF